MAVWVGAATVLGAIYICARAERTPERAFAQQKKKKRVANRVDSRKGILKAERRVEREQTHNIDLDVSTANIYEDFKHGPL